MVEGRTVALIREWWQTVLLVGGPVAVAVGIGAWFLRVFGWFTTTTFVVGVACLFAAFLPRVVRGFRPRLDVEVMPRPAPPVQGDTPLGQLLNALTSQPPPTMWLARVTASGASVEVLSATLCYAAAPSGVQLPWRDDGHVGPQRVNPHEDFHYLVLPEDANVSVSGERPLLRLVRADRVKPFEIYV